MLKDRKGFIKLAIQTGAALVPVFSFGENDIYDQFSGTKIRKFQSIFKKFTGIVPPIVVGHGLVPRQVPITTVVGSIIEVTKNDSPTDREINDLHKKFVSSLKDLFDDHKEKYTKFPNVKLIIE